MGIRVPSAEADAFCAGGVRPSAPRVERAVLLAVSLAVVVLHMATNGRYGFHRDELQFLSDARHLDWGFVAYPPFTPLVEHVGLKLFGLSLVGLRVFSVIAQGLVIYVAGLMARELGGRGLAQFTAAFAVALSPLPLFEGTEFQYSSFDMLWWVLIAYFTIRLLRTEDARWWLAIGAAIGLGLETKYSIAFYIAGVVAGVVLSPARRYLRSGWFYAGAGLALLIFLPNLVWLVRHDFISYHFLQSIHARDVGEGRARGYFSGQFWLCVNAAADPIWIAGLVAYLRSPRYRMLGWMYLTPLALFAVAKGRFYYLAAGYPMLLAMGAVVGERWLGGLGRRRRIAIGAVAIAGIAGVGGYVSSILIPLARGGDLRAFALKNNGDLREEFGWQELVQNVAAIRDGLTAEQRGSFGVLVGNYGEAGAVELLGPAYELPAPISMTNSGWLRSYPAALPSTVIVVGYSRKGAESRFTDCRLAGHNGNAAGVENEESRDHPDIFLCGPPRNGWAAFWKEGPYFG